VAADVEVTTKVESLAAAGDAAYLLILYSYVNTNINISI
jgi:hypothetical protein